MRDVIINQLRSNYLARNSLILGVALLGACGHKPSPTPAGPQATAPLPTAGISGQQVIVLPFTLIAAEDSLRWEGALGNRRVVLGRADSIALTLLQARAPEVNWLGPEELRRAARHAPGIAPDPDQMGTAILRARTLEVVPDPLRSQLRTLAALAGNGGSRYAFVPAALVFKRTGTAVPPVGLAELTIVLADTRTGRIGWRTVATGEGTDPWSALTRAVKSLTPGLP